MRPERQIYLLDPQKYSPEVIAVAFAKTSRSPESFQQIADELTDEKSAKFHERWVVGYGHSSVAEHAVLHIAVENISRLAVECLESNRLASYTEKSTRYQKWDAENFHLPEELKGHPLEGKYLDTCRLLFSTYAEAMEKVRSLADQDEPLQEGEAEATRQNRIRAKCADVCRFLLPASAQANVGLTINARALEHAIVKLLSSALAEVRAIGEEIKSAALSEVPTLVKYAEADPTQRERETAFGKQAALDAEPTRENSDWCHLVRFDPDAEEMILAAALYRQGSLTWEQSQGCTRKLSSASRDRLLKLLFTSRNRHESLPRELEYARYTFDLVLDQGAYFELKRHRMMTQSAQPLGVSLGFALPRWISLAGMEADYRTAMQAAAETYQAIFPKFPQAASYIVPNAYRRRLLLDFNLRSGIHMLSLRSAANAHFSMRRVSQRMVEEICQVNSWLTGFLQVKEDESWQSIQRDYFTFA
jgi:thymidylate synthase ThyX